MSAELFIGIMAALSSFYVVLGWYVSRGMENKLDFFFAGRKLGVSATTATLLATQIGGGMFIGTAQDPFRGILYVCGIIISFLVLGMGIARNFRAFNIETVADIFQTHYKSTFLARICALLYIVTLCGILLSQTIAMKSVIANFNSGGIDYLFPVLWMVIVLYTLLGGLQAIIAVDLAQVALVLVVFTALFIAGVMTDTTPLLSHATVSRLTTVFDKSGLGFGEIMRILTISSCYSIITQDIAHRFFSVKNQHVATRAAFCASIILLAFAVVPFYFGIKAQFLPSFSSEKSPLFAALETVTSNPLFLVIAMCALMAAITSTIDSLLCAIASIITSLSTPFFKKKHDEIILSRLVIVLCGMTIFIGSYFVPQEIITTLVNSYEISVACLFVAIIGACVRKRELLKPCSAYLSVGFGFAGFIFGKMNSVTWLNSWTLPIALGLSLIGYVLGDLFFRPGHCPTIK